MVDRENGPAFRLKYEILTFRKSVQSLDSNDVTKKGWIIVSASLITPLISALPCEELQYTDQDQPCSCTEAYLQSNRKKSWDLL